MKVSLYTRDRSSRKFRKATHHKLYPAGTIFVLRYGDRWETLKVDSYTDASIKCIERELAIRTGWHPAAPQASPRAKAPELMLDSATDTYLAEIEAGRKRKTFLAYAVSLKYFFECTKNKPLTAIERADLLNFSVFLRKEKGQSERSAYNKFEAVMTFLKHFEITGVKLKIKAHDWPKFVEEEPEIYEQIVLDTFFAECDADELLLFEFFLKTGMREQEVMYTTDRSLDFSANLVAVKHNPEYGWTPKMYKERTIPVPVALMTKLKKMLTTRGKGGLLFPTVSGKPKGDYLDMAKAIARRSGIPQDQVWLHKFRATFATRALWGNVDLRTVQAWMGHTDLASTLRYLKPNNAAAMREKVENIWK